MPTAVLVLVLVLLLVEWGSATRIRTGEDGDEGPKIHELRFKMKELTAKHKDALEALDKTRRTRIKQVNEEFHDTMENLNAKYVESKKQADTLRDADVEVVEGQHQQKLVKLVDEYEGKRDDLREKIAEQQGENQGNLAKLKRQLRDIRKARDKAVMMNNKDFQDRSKEITDMIDELQDDKCCVVVTKGCNPCAEVHVSVEEEEGHMMKPTIILP